jgi:uncharacterized protein (DUF1778 family)
VLRILPPRAGLSISSAARPIRQLVAAAEGDPLLPPGGGRRTSLTRYGIWPYIQGMQRQIRTTARLEARLPSEVLERLKRAAEIQGRSLTDFVVAAADEAACRAIEQTEIIRLSVEDQRQIAEAILNPPEPTPALRRTVRKYRELFGVE